MDTLVPPPPPNPQPEAADSKPRSMAYDVSSCPAEGPSSSCNVSCTPGRLDVRIRIQVQDPMPFRLELILLWEDDDDDADAYADDADANRRGHLAVFFQFS